MTTDTIRPLFTWRSAICESNLAPTTRHVALTLALYMSERGRNTHPDANKLANALQPTQPAPATNRDTA